MEATVVTLGYYDAKDILEWIEYIVEFDPHAEIILHGISMGAATILILSDSTLILGNTKLIIADSSYTTAMEYVRNKLKGIPVIPELMSWFTDKIAGYSLMDASPLEHVKSSRISILFIHGKKDKTVPVEQVYSLYNAAGRSRSYISAKMPVTVKPDLLIRYDTWIKLFLSFKRTVKLIREELIDNGYEIVQNSCVFCDMCSPLCIVYFCISFK